MTLSRSAACPWVHKGHKGSQRVTRDHTLPTHGHTQWSFLSKHFSITVFVLVLDSHWKTNDLTKHNTKSYYLQLKKDELILLSEPMTFFSSFFDIKLKY